MGSPAGFSRAMRLTEKAVFAQLLRTRNRMQSGPLTLQWLDNGLRLPRLGMAAAKRHIPHAVQRNLLKRLLREAVRLRQTEFYGMDLFLSSRGALAPRGQRPDRRRLREDIRQLLDRLAERKQA